MKQKELRVLNRVYVHKNQIATTQHLEKQN